MNVKGGRIVNKQKISKLLYWIPVALFLTGWALLFFGTFIFKAHGADDYYNEKEIKSAETVRIAAYYPKTDLIYVFYETGKYVNVYDTYGDFKWAFHIPYYPSGHPDIRFSEGKLYYVHNDGYVVDALGGQLIETLGWEQARDMILEKEPEADVINSTLLKVEYEHPDGSTSIIVSKSSFIMILCPPVGMCIAGLGAVPLFIRTVAVEVRKKKNKRKALIKKHDKTRSE